MPKIRLFRARTSGWTAYLSAFGWRLHGNGLTRRDALRDALASRRFKRYRT